VLRMVDVRRQRGRDQVLRSSILAGLNFKFDVS
jgi:hypothetical protein